MRTLMFAVAMSALTLAAGAATAGDVKYSSEDVVDFFLKSVDVGATRGICVGTAQECAQQTRPAGFDVMVNFDLASARLTPDAVENLSQVALALADPRLSGAKFAIDGYTDARGTEAYNQTLSAERADAVAAFLISRGVPAERLVAVGNGESNPRVSDPFDPVNRRVEMRINLN